jgi:diacylglycerol kinase (ATP)
LSKTFRCIINPSAGQDEAILSILNRRLKESDLDWDIALTKKPGDATRLAKQFVDQGVGLIAAYGGDGTIAEALRGLAYSATPLLILPGGTANVLARDLGLPLSSEEIIQAYLAEQLVVKSIDLGFLNRQPFVLGLSCGLVANLADGVSRELKDQWGILAYVLGPLGQLQQETLTTYRLKLDGQTYEEEAVSLIVANTGQLGLTGMSFAPNIKIDDGKLDLLLLRSAGVKTMFEWAKAAATQERPDGALVHYTAKRIEIEQPQSAAGMIDDETQSLPAHMTIEVAPAAVRVWAPKPLQDDSIEAS